MVTKENVDTYCPVSMKKRGSQLSMKIVLAMNVLEVKYIGTPTYSHILDNIKELNEELVLIKNKMGLDFPVP